MTFSCCNYFNHRDFGSRHSVRSSTTMVHDADIDPTELEAVVENLDATPGNSF